MKKVYTLGFIFLVAISTVMATPAVQAQDMKIGFVEPRAVLERMPEMRAVQQRLQNFAERKQNELMEKERELQTEIELYQQKAGVISENARQQEEERLTAMDTEFRQMQQQAQQEMAQQRAQLMQPLLEQIQQAIDAVAARKGLDYVLNTTTSGGDVIILYVSPNIRDEYDITDEVMDELDI
ncbi:OmpH family outer membrane protein [Rhodohalobacter halophilus]|uniref:OmpH family outer membrane protein n=1 Tax=Rhodohalobacter halophilus TaxID=1812810 RepID=UPI00083F5ECB|nr:OmpH family outer membrane protein [Rhodohalobacter halophilus]